MSDGWVLPAVLVHSRPTDDKRCSKDRSSAIMRDVHDVTDSAVMALIGGVAAADDGYSTDRNIGLGGDFIHGG